MAPERHKSLNADELESHRRRLRYKISRHVGPYCPDLDDLVQETLIRFLRSLEGNTIRNLDNIGGFLNGVSNHVIHEYRRRLWRETPYEVETHESAPVRPEADYLELREATQAALSQLSNRDSAVLRAFYLQDRTKEEICREHGLSDPQFRVIVFRAKERFRKIYLKQ